MALLLFPDMFFIPHPLELHDPVLYLNISLSNYQPVSFLTMVNDSLINKRREFLCQLKKSNVKIIITQV